MCSIKWQGQFWRVMGCFFSNKRKTLNPSNWSFLQIKLQMDLHSLNQSMFWKTTLIYINGSILLAFQPSRCWWPLWYWNVIQITKIRKLKLRNQLNYYWWIIFEWRLHGSWRVCLWWNWVSTFHLGMQRTVGFGWKIKEVSFGPILKH